MAEDPRDRIIDELEGQVENLTSYIKDAASAETLLVPVSTMTKIGARAEAALRERDRFKEELAALLAWAEAPEGQGPVRRTTALERARKALGRETLV
jgi:hypothetical protein